MRPKFQLITASILLLAGSASASDTLYNSSEARTPSPALQEQLGVRSGGVRYDARMIRAARIAMERSHARTTWYCWRYVKDALVAAQVVNERPSTAYAKQAGDELCQKFGFRKLATRNPAKAPVGAVIVYGGDDAGHVEIRTSRGYVSDFWSSRPYPRPVIGIYVKPV